jgi:alanine-synthesizing transaminase
VHRFTYAIRNIVAEALKVEAAGTRVRYLNIGDPSPSGSKPRRTVAAVERGVRDGHNNYGPSAGIRPPVKLWLPSTQTAFRSPPIACSSPRERRKASSFALGAVVETGGECSCRCPRTALHRRALKLDAKRKYYRLDASRVDADLDHLEKLVTPATRALVIIDPNNPTRRRLFDRDTACAAPSPIATGS